MHMRRKLISRIGPTYWLNLKGLGECGRYEEIVKLAMMSRPRMRKAQILIVQPNPTLGSRWTTMIGKMTPPKDEPAIANPPAIARLLWKYVIGYKSPSQSQTLGWQTSWMVYRSDR
jgi:hypothetical protein